MQAARRAWPAAGSCQRLPARPTPVRRCASPGRPTAAGQHLFAPWVALQGGLVVGRGRAASLQLLVQAAPPGQQFSPAPAAAAASQSILEPQEGLPQGAHGSVAGGAALLCSLPAACGAGCAGAQQPVKGGCSGRVVPQAQQLLRALQAGLHTACTLDSPLSVRGMGLSAQRRAWLSPSATGAAAG